MAAYPSCPTLVARHVWGNFSTAVGSEDGWIFSAQALSHGRWRTVGRARSTAAGDWQSRVRVGSRRRFRARIGRQAGYPFVAGVSRVLALRRS